MSQSTTQSRPLPLIGWIARDIGRDINIVFYIIVIALTVLALAVKTWGMVALTMAALPMVPVMFAIFIWISLP